MIFSKIMETPSHGWKSYELGSVCPTIHRPSASFLGIGLQLFFWNSAWCCPWAWHLDFLKKDIFASKMGKMGQKWGVLGNQKSWSIICLEVCIICCIPVQIPYFGKIGFCDMNQNALGQSDCRIFKSTISQEQIDEIAWFVAWWSNSWKLKIYLKILGWVWLSNGCSQSRHSTQKLALYQEEILE